MLGMAKFPVHRPVGPDRRAASYCRQSMALLLIAIHMLDPDRSCDVSWSSLNWLPNRTGTCLMQSDSEILWNSQDGWLMKLSNKWVSKSLVCSVSGRASPARVECSEPHPFMTTRHWCKNRLVDAPGPWKSSWWWPVEATLLVARILRITLNPISCLSHGLWDTLQYLL